MNRVNKIRSTRTIRIPRRQSCQKGAKDLKTLIDERDDVSILNFLESQSKNKNEDFKSAVLQLTILNDPETLESILAWGEKNGLTPAKGGQTCQGNPNPILITCQQDFRRCMDHLYHHGYRRGDTKEGDDDEDDDQVKQYLRFQSASNTNYLSLEFTEHNIFQDKANDNKIKSAECLNLQKFDPIRNVYKLMNDADENMENFQGSSELKSQYKMIKAELEQFAAGILDQCKTMNEVKTILEHNPEDDDDDELDDADTNWQKALFNGHKELVSHSNFQQYFWKMMINGEPVNIKIPIESKLGATAKFRIKRAIWNFKNVPITLLTFLFCYPFVVFADLFKKADILFVSQEAKQHRRLKKKESNVEGQQLDEGGDSNGCFDYFRKRMHVPLYRMINYFAFQMCYLLILCLSIWNPVDLSEANFHNPDKLRSTILMTVTFIIAINFLVDDIIQMFRAHFFLSEWHMLSLVTHLLLVGGASITGISFHYFYRDTPNIADLSGNNVVNVGLAMLSFGAGMEFFRLLRWLVLLELTGPIVLCVMQAIRDALRMVSIYIVIFIAHAIAFWSLYKPFQPDSAGPPPKNYTLSENAKVMKTTRGLFSALFWRIIASAGPEMVNINNTQDEINDFSMEFSHLMGLVLWGIYQIIIYVLMLNLLIAVMNTSYSELWQNAQKEWKYSKSFFQVQFMEPLETFPVPFRCIYYLAKAVYLTKKKKDLDPIKEDQEKYFRLLRDLILNKKEAEFEKTQEDKMNDLKKDIINEIKKQGTIRLNIN